MCLGFGVLWRLVMLRRIQPYWPWGVVCRCTANSDHSERYQCDPWSSICMCSVPSGSCMWINESHKDARWSWSWLWLWRWFWAIYWVTEMNVTNSFNNTKECWCYCWGVKRTTQRGCLTCFIQGCLFSIVNVTGGLLKLVAYCQICIF